MAGGGGITGNPSTSIFGGGITGNPSTSIFGGGGYVYDQNGVPVHQGVYGPMPEGAVPRSELPAAEEYRRKKIVEALVAANEAFNSGGSQKQQQARLQSLLGPTAGIDMVPVQKPLEARYGELPVPILMQLLFGQKK